MGPATATPSHDPSLDDDDVRELLNQGRSPDWERLIEEGTVPALALGAERRLRRHADKL